MDSAHNNPTLEAKECDATKQQLSESGIIVSQAYETQFFGFTPKSFTDGLYNAVVEYIHDGLVSISKVLKLEYKQSSKSEQELRVASEHVFQGILPNIGKAFDKLELYVFQNVFGLPKSVLLKEDRIRIEYPSANSATINELEDEIQTLEKKIKAARYNGACLRQELADTEPLVARLRQEISDQTSLLSTLQAVNDSRESIQETLRQQSEFTESELISVTLSNKDSTS